MSQLISVAIIVLAWALPLNAQLPFKYTIYGSQSNESFGQGLALGPDFDGDGRPDILVGSPGRQDANGVARGALQAFSSLDGSQLFGRFGENLNDGFGSRIISGFDLDQDGIADYAVSAPRLDHGIIDIGRVYLISGATRSQLAQYDGTNFRSFMGAALAWAGDVDGDGVQDLIAGGFGATISLINQGEVVLISGATRLPIRRHFGSLAGDNLGVGLAGLGDLDGDGFDDYAIAAPGVDRDGLPNRGEVTIHSGATGVVIRRHMGRNSFSSYGAAMTALRDLNGDGINEYAIGSATDSTVGINAGLVELRNGADGSLIFTRFADSASDRFGVNLANGDFDGDGRDEILVAATGDSAGGIGAGSVFLIDDSGEILERIDGAYYAFLGQQVVNAGDLEGDGIDDYLLSSSVSQGLNLSTGSVILGTHLGAVVSGPPATYGLGLTFRPGSVLPHQGSVDISGPPGFLGSLLFSTTSNQTIVNGLPILIDPTSLTSSYRARGGPTGFMSLPLDLRQPALAGLVLHLQAFSTIPGATQVSPRLSVLFGL